MGIDQFCVPPPKKCPGRAHNKRKLADTPVAGGSPATSPQDDSPGLVQVLGILNQIQGTQAEHSRQLEQVAEQQRLFVSREASTPQQRLEEVDQDVVEEQEQVCDQGGDGPDHEMADGEFEPGQDPPAAPEGGLDPPAPEDKPPAAPTTAGPTLGDIAGLTTAVGVPSGGECKHQGVLAFSWGQVKTAFGHRKAEWEALLAHSLHAPQDKDEVRKLFVSCGFTEADVKLSLVPERFMSGGGHFAGYQVRDNRKS